MWKPLLWSIFLAGVFAAEDTYQNTPKAPIAQQAPQTTRSPYNKPVQQAGVKNGTAPGRYYGGGDDSREYDRSGYHQGHRIFRGFDVPLVDDYICDLDATILIVTNSDAPNAFSPEGGDNGAQAPAASADSAAPTGDNNYGRAKRSAYLPPDYEPGRDNYGPQRDYPPRDYYDGRENYDGYGKDRYDSPPREYGPKHDYDFDHHHYGYGPGVVANADRLRCSVIAGNDEDSCTTCCRLSARRDRSISKDKIIGFLVDNNQVSYDAQAPTSEGYADNYADRKKRSENVAPDATYYSQYQTDAPPADVPTPDADYRCVCCAPKRYRPFIFDRFFRRHHRYQQNRYGGGPY